MRPNLARETVFDGKRYEAKFSDEETVALFCEDAFVGFAAWSRKRIEDPPEGLPRAVVVTLSQQLRTGLLGQRIARHTARKDRPTREQVRELFRNLGLPDVPPGCQRWARVRMRHIYSVFVLVEQETLVFRNWLMIGKGLWSDKNRAVERYIGEKVPEPVWERLTRQLTEQTCAISTT